MMDTIDPEDSDEETERFGNNFISNLHLLSKENQKIHLYLSKIKEMTARKDNIRQKIRSEIEKTT